MIHGLYEFASKWSRCGSVWMFSDPHFDDEGIKKYYSDWPTPDEQVRIIKKFAHRQDTLVMLGDIGNPEYMFDIESYCVLITGNHDAGKTKYIEYFDEVYNGPLFINNKILLSHEPVFGLPFVFNIHGHDHSGAEFENHLNVCANVVGYKPISLGKLIKNGGISGVPNIHSYTSFIRQDGGKMY